MPASHSITARPPRGTEGRTHVAVVSPLENRADIVSGFLEDAAHFPGGHAEAVSRPSQESEVWFTLVNHAPILIAGAQSSLTGGATPHGGVVLSTQKLT